ncbi:DsrE family protein [Brytella acorum]|uniref:DsrE family protein n=1 Tax=Brytella acorum TaxID=2959299 RepID=A0AA35XXX2_9PROT|nr:DsrE family protein [Brytella acorum]MDF3623880.1 DsrE family protein [Brytella acorum]CAI9120796.1 DsrE family protein [Brytella acorum]
MTLRSPLLCLLLGTAMIAPTTQAAPSAQPAQATTYGDQKTVYQNNGAPVNQPVYFTMLLHSLRNQITAVGKDHVKIVVVNFGAGVDLLIQAQTDRALASQIDMLKADGVQFAVCANTMKGRHLRREQLYGVAEQDIVPSAVAEITHLQSIGFAYIHL